MLRKLSTWSCLMNRVQGQITTSRYVLSDLKMGFSIFHTVLQPRRHRLFKKLRGIAAKVLGICCFNSVVLEFGRQTSTESFSTVWDCLAAMLAWFLENRMWRSQYPGIRVLGRSFVVQFSEILCDFRLTQSS